MRPFAKRALGILGLSLLVTVMGFQAAPAVPNLILYYKFDETVGNIAHDSSGNGYDGTWTTGNNAPTIGASTDVGMVPAVPGNVRSIMFGKPTANLPLPKDGAYVATPSNNAFTFTGPFSAMAWVKPSTYAAGENANDRGSIVHKWDYGTSQLSGWSFERELDGRVTFITGSRTQTDFLSGTVTLPFGAWHHVAVVYTGPPVGGAANKFIYVDGVLNASKSTTIVPASSGADLHVGKDDYYRNFYGNVDEVRLFDGALTATQVMQCYNGVHAPLNLVATKGADEADLTWTASATADSYDIYRSTNVQGGPYTFLANVAPGSTNSYVDLTATNGSTYYYVLKSRVGTLASAYSNEAFCTPDVSQIVVNPRAISVAEAGGTATFTVTLLTRPVSQVQITLTSANAAALLVNGPGGTPAGSATLTFLPNQPLTQTVTATGVERFVQGPDLMVNINFTSVTSTDPLYPASYLPRPVSCRIIQDRPGLVINPAAGLATTNGGPAITFTVALATQAIGNAMLTFSVSDPNLATVAPPGPITLTAANSPVTITVTPLTVDTSTTYTAPYTININSSTSTDAGYAALGVTRVPIFMETNLPPLEHLWKCGLIGLEGLLAMSAIALWRRRRSRKSD
ncbi:MAG: LamG domain-containing protein [Planctomycetaceae bacterium]|nr:LamG domain-containing protein [Planctomycetaceae bacterium]